MIDLSPLLKDQTAADAAAQGIKADEYAILLDWGARRTRWNSASSR